MDERKIAYPVSYLVQINRLSAQEKIFLYLGHKLVNHTFFTQWKQLLRINTCRFYWNLKVSSKLRSFVING